MYVLSVSVGYLLSNQCEMDLNENKTLLDRRGQRKCCASCCKIPPLNSRNFCPKFDISTCCQRDRAARIEPLGSWLSLIAAFGINLIVVVVELSYGLLYGHLKDKYGANEGVTGMLIVASYITFCVAGVAAAPFVTMYGCRPVALLSTVVLTLGICLSAWSPHIAIFILLFGVFGGTGLGGSHIAATTIVQQCFPYNRGLATGISSLGFTAGTVLGPVAVDSLLEVYGLSGGVLLLGGICMQGIICSAIMNSPNDYVQYHNTSQNETEYIELSNHKKKGAEENTKEITNGEISGASQNPRRNTSGETRKFRDQLRLLFFNMLDFSILKNIPYLLCVLYKVFLVISTLGMTSHTVSAAIDKGIPEGQAAYLMTIVGLCNLVTKVITSVTLNYDVVGPVPYIGFGALLLALSGYIAAIATAYETFVGAMVLMGTYEGVTNTAIYLVIVAIIGKEDYAKSFAVHRFCTLPASLVGAPFAGWLKDETGDYFATFVMIGVSSTISTVLSIVIYVVGKVRNTAAGLESDDSESSAPSHGE